MNITSASGMAGTGYAPAGTGHSGSGRQELDPQQQKQLRELKRRDREVRAHERAHIAGGGQYVRGGATYQYQTGPDNKQYAVGGEVSIDTSPIRGDPEATIRKMQVVRKSALAPANPSSQDRMVAAKASQAQAQARQQLQKQKSGGDTHQASAGTGADRNPNPLGLNQVYSPHGKPFMSRQTDSNHIDMQA